MTSHATACLLFGLLSVLFSRFSFVGFSHVYAHLCGGICPWGQVPEEGTDFLRPGATGSREPLEVDAKVGSSGRAVKHS